MLVTIAILATSGACGAAPTASGEPTYIDQGKHWSNEARADFYTRDQGSHLMPMAWLKALKHPDGQPFLADQLGRYGYLPNPGNPAGLPVGFTLNKKFVGLSCAACHTRQISVNGTDYRIDGGPAIVDAQSMFMDFDDAFAATLSSDTNFWAFAGAVLDQPNPNPDTVAKLKTAVQAWFLRYHTIIQRAMPTPAWGPGRLDAVGMILNRLTGLDLGPAPSFLIPDNIKRADAQVRYPFLWNAAKQDQTQWPGFLDNGSDLLGLARNVGEVYGVFADFTPQKNWWHLLLGVDYLNNNSANFDGLAKLEDLIKKIGPPKYPWAIDTNLAAQGEVIYDRPTALGGCADCHGIKPGKTRFLDHKTWATPIMDVGTDSHEYDIMGWEADTGVLEGQDIPLLSPKLKARDLAFNALQMSVLGTIIQHYAPFLTTEANIGMKGATRLLANKNTAVSPTSLKLPKSLQDLKGAFNHPTNRTATTNYAYEARVLEGVWAAAPYLHNGSVPTLAALLEPAGQRPKAFKIGPNYDLVNLGLAIEQTKFGDQTLTTSTKRASGNANCGHEFGTTLSADEKKALLEYMKTL
jgi:hypothetical protein